jgi:hypothetical protein
MDSPGTRRPGAGLPLPALRPDAQVERADRPRRVTGPISQPANCAAHEIAASWINSRRPALRARCCLHLKALRRRARAPPIPSAERNSGGNRNNSMPMRMKKGGVPLAGAVSNIPPLRLLRARRSAQSTHLWSDTASSEMRGSARAGARAARRVSSLALTSNMDSRLSTHNSPLDAPDTLKRGRPAEIDPTRIPSLGGRCSRQLEPEVTAALMGAHIPRISYTVSSRGRYASRDLQYRWHARHNCHAPPVAITRVDIQLLPSQPWLLLFPSTACTVTWGPADGACP